MNALKVAKKNDDLMHILGALGTDFHLQEETKQGLHRFVCSLYDQEDISVVNLARYQIFKGGKFGEEFLPPNEDCLDLHLQRANYQCYLWRNTTKAVFSAPNITQHGWVVKDGKVGIKWMDLAPAPDMIMAFINCFCKKGCKTNRCSCKNAQMSCSELCKCSSCENGDLEEICDDDNDNDTYDDVHGNDNDQCEAEYVENVSSDGEYDEDL